MKKAPIKTRIQEHWYRGITYYDLMDLVFPEKEYPRAWRCRTGGGPPGCAMAFGKALRELGVLRLDNDVLTRPRGPVL